MRFTPATLVEYSGATRSGCGTAQSAMGPFYCPNDRKIYLDMSFFRDMQRKLGGGGDFAYAYVISHEYGHHIQNLIGLLPKTQAAQQNASSQAQANNISVRVELMADCLAGVWAANAEQKWHFLEQGDVEKAINTAQAIGDDRLQQQGQGRRRTGLVHARLVATARAMAAARAAIRAGRFVQHVRALAQCLGRQLKQSPRAVLERNGRA